jgi:hypothetical protein
VGPGLDAHGPQSLSDAPGGPGGVVGHEGEGHAETVERSDGIRGPGDGLAPPVEHSVEVEEDGIVAIGQPGPARGGRAHQWDILARARR